MLGAGFQEKVKGVEDSHFCDQVHRHFELSGLVWKDQTRLVIGERVLLPVDEVFSWFHLDAVRQDVASTVGCRSQANDLRSQLNGAVVTVVRYVMQCDMNGHKCK